MQEAFADLFMMVPALRELSAQEATTLAEYLCLLELTDGEIVCEEGDPGDFMCYVIDGALDVVKHHSWSGESTVIASIGASCSVGEMSVLDNQPRSATLRAQGSVRLAVLDKTSFAHICQYHPHIAIKMLQGIVMLLSQHLRDTSQALAQHMLPVT